MPINVENPVLVLGGAGYIGSHMVLALQAAGFVPIVLDNLSKGKRSSVKDALFIEGDYGDWHLLQTLFSKNSFQAVIHFAGLIEVSESIKYPGKYYQNNVSKTLNLLDAMQEHHVDKIIFSSTAAVYGEPRYTPIDELHPLSPINPYGRSKRMIEEIIQDYAQSSHLNYALLRYFNAAGADPAAQLGERHHPESHLIPLLLQVAKGERECIEIFGNDYATPDGTCIRDYIHVHDLCSAHLLALKYLLKTGKNLICNLGTGVGFSVQEVIQMTEQIVGLTLPKKLIERRIGDPAILIADAKHAQKTLGWLPKYPQIKDMIAHSWAYTSRFTENV